MLVRNASVAATELIREAIIEGRLEPGQRLKEEELARELGISRTPVREALLMLQAEDWSSPRRTGARPSASTTRRTSTSSTSCARSSRDSRPGARQRISTAELELLRGSCVRFDALSPDSDLRELVRENLFFHDTILSVAERPPDGARAQGDRAAARLQLVPLVLRRAEADLAHYHRQIVKALADGTPSAPS